VSSVGVVTRSVLLCGILAGAWLRSLEPFLRTYIALVVPGDDPRWSADLHVPILKAVRERDPKAVVAAVERRISEVSENMARRLPAGDERTA